jgi:ankyrin repeat protein
VLGHSTYDSFEETVLHRACYSGKFEVVQFLLQVHADPCCTQSKICATSIHRCEDTSKKNLINVFS